MIYMFGRIGNIAVHYADLTLLSSAIVIKFSQRNFSSVKITQKMHLGNWEAWFKPNYLIVCCYRRALVISAKIVIN